MSQAAAVATMPPWQRSWFYRAPGESATLLWILMLHVVVAAGLILLPLPPWQAMAIAVGLMFVGGLGTTIAYHRSLAHGSIVLNPVIEQALIVAACANGSGNPLTWVANHRLHHANSDTEADISSPRVGGFWWAHLRWLWQSEPAQVQRYCPKLDRPRYRVWRWLQPLMLAISCFGGLMWLDFAPWKVALAACLWIGPLRLLWSLHFQCAVNSVCHLGPSTGAHGTARNVWWLAAPQGFIGENWHENHHETQTSARFARRWWQIDIGWLVVVVLRWCRLARLRNNA